MKTLSKEQKAKLLQEFNKLKNVKGKFQFWRKNLGMEYVEFLELQNPKTGHKPKPILEQVHSFQEFLIRPKSTEAKAYNEQIVNQYCDTCISKGKPSSIIGLEHLVADYRSQLKSVSDKAMFLAHKLREVEDVITHKRLYKETWEDNSGPIHFLKGYDDQYLRGMLDLATVPYGYPDILDLLNGNAWAKFRQYLDEELKLLEQNKKGVKTKKKELSIKQQLIVLHYLGTLDKVKEAGNASKQADFLSLLLNKSTQNIRKEFSSIEELTFSRDRKKRANIRKDLELALELFHSLGLKQFQRSIEADLQKLETAPK